MHQCSTIPRRMTKTSLSTLGPLALLVVAGTVAYVSVVLCLPASSSPAPEHEQGTSTASTSSELPPLFDFEHYQQQFGKKYGSQLEADTRRNYLLANALQVYISGIAYKFRDENSYLALNHMSDWSPLEIAMMENRVLAGFSSQVENQSPSDATTKSADATNDPNRVAKKLEEKIERILEEANSRGLHLDEKLRKKRETYANQKHLGPRSFSMDKLIQDNGPVKESPEVMAKWDKNPKKGNKLYDPFQMERSTMGVQFIEESVKWAWPSLDSLLIGDPHQEELLRRGYNSRVGPAGNDEKPVMFVDLREFGCMFEPRDQGDCGSCYAFAGITMFEWLFCRRMNKLVAFSEQYLVDCGKDRFENMHGCMGGNPVSVANFVNTFGLEIGSSYKYAGRETECPLGDNPVVETTGFIRMDVDFSSVIPIAAWHRTLEYTPIMVNVATYPGFTQYGGGVYDGKNCRQKASHNMVVVGHGRESGQEFWLIRNSYGPHWGDKGYFKLAKSAAERCIENQRGYVFATLDGKDYWVEPRIARP